MRRALLLLGILACPVRVDAAETRVSVPASDGAEVCRFAAGDRENPFQRWLADSTPVCVPSGSSLAFPAGLSNVFARSRNGISIDPVVVDGSAAPSTLTFSVAAAATLVVHLPPGDRGVLYAPKRVIAFPAAERMTVPAGEELWLFVMSQSTAVGIVEIAAIPQGSERTVDLRELSGARAIVGWTHIAESDRDALQNARGVRQPSVTAIVEGKQFEAVSLPAPEMLGGAFVLFRGVPAGPAEVQLSGRGWLTHRRQIQIAAKPVTTMVEPIPARPTARIAVNWSLPYNAAAIERSLGSCEVTPDTPRFDLTISACAPSKGSEPEACQPVKTEPLRTEVNFGTVAVDEVPPGLYRAELRYGKLPPAGTTAQVRPLSQTTMQLQGNYFAGYGDLTRGGKPIAEDMRIAFPGGGVGFSARNSGEYYAALTQLFGVDARIDVITCGGNAFFVLADRPATRNGRFDIDIPDNSLTLTVIDTFTRAAVRSATIRLVVMSLSGRGPVMSRKMEPDDEGRLALRGLPQRELRIEVSRSGYRTKELAPFTLGKTENKEIEVQLEPVSGMQAKLVSARPFRSAIIYWFSASGSEIEHAEVDPDGTFAFDANHYRDETMTVVSLSHPLWIARPPSAARGRVLEIRFPDGAPERRAEVTIAGAGPRMTTPIGVAIGGLRVPQPALARHQALRELTTLVRGEGPLSIPGLAETGPIDILRGPSQFVAPQAMEFFASRDFAPRSSQRLTAQSPDVVFK
jgi:hypothetical protein